MRSATVRKKARLGTVLFFIAVGIALLGSFYLISSASAQTTVFQDNFDGETLGAPTATPLTNWTVAGAGGVDVLGSIPSPGFSDVYPGNGNYLDMDGTCGNATITSSPLTLPAGTYTLSFEFGNYSTESGNILKVSFGTVFTQNFSTPALNSPPTLTPEAVSFSVTTSTTGSIVFQETGGSVNCVGTILDDVKLTSPAIVDIDAKINTNLNRIPAHLAAGSYLLTVVGPAQGGKFTAWNAWGTVTNCPGNPDGSGCSTGWLTQYWYTPGVQSAEFWGRMAIVDTKPFKLRVILHRIFVERPQVTGIPAWPGGAACYRRSRYIL